jgi:6,7-dimethyl-8-ribityllumazine synthase
MPRYSGRLKSSRAKVGVVVSRFNEFITGRLLESAIQVFEQCGISFNNVDVVWVPGALEIPFFCQKLARKNKYEGLLAIGCVIRGETYHYECVAHEVTRGVSQVGLSEGIPIATAILTVEHLEQAIDRAGLKAGNKGGHAALALIEMMDLSRQVASHA